MKLHRFGLLAGLALIIINCFLASYNLFFGDILFHTDIARDFLVLDDIVVNHKPTLLGPRSGGISGVFHGPLWFYINLPAFVLAKGDPIIVGWFWVILSMISIWVTYYFGKKIFNRQIALLAAILLSVFVISFTKSLFNPFGAVVLFPVFFYLFHKYITTTKNLYLLFSLFTIGLIIQFQIAFGGPLLLLTTIYLIPKIIKKKKYYHFLSYFILAIPLSTYIFFELRHDFLQTRALISYLSSSHNADGMSLGQLAFNRLKGAFIDGISLIPQNSLLSIPVLLLFGSILYKLKRKNIKYREIYFLFFYFHFGYWIITLAYKGTVWGYYYWPFLPLTLLIFCSAIELINKKLFFIIFSIVLLSNLFFGVQSIYFYDSGWKIYHKIAHEIYKNANGSDFGYYIYTPDQFGYSGKYAMIYTRREFKNTNSFPYKKKKLTYLIISPAPKDKPWLNGDWWIDHQVNISRKPDTVIKYPNGIVVNKYLLSEKEVKIPSDPNLLQTLIFR